MAWISDNPTKKDSLPLLQETVWNSMHCLIFIKNPGKNAGKKFERRSCVKIPSPSRVGKTVIVRQAVLLALDHSSPKPSQDFHPSGIWWVCSPIQWRDRAGITPDFPIKPLRAPIPVWNCQTNSDYVLNSSTGFSGCQQNNYSFLIAVQRSFLTFQSAPGIVLYSGTHRKLCWSRDTETGFRSWRLDGFQ